MSMTVFFISVAVSMIMFSSEWSKENFFNEQNQSKAIEISWWGDQNKICLLPCNTDEVGPGESVTLDGGLSAVIIFELFSGLWGKISIYKKKVITSGSKWRIPTARKRPPEKALARLISFELFLNLSLEKSKKGEAGGKETIWEEDYQWSWSWRTW